MARREAECTCKTCGEIFYKMMYGRNVRDAESKVEWAESFFDECEDCHRKRLEDERIKRMQDAIESGLPPLEGTQKQIVWASDLRDGVLQRVDKNFDLIKEVLDAGGYKDEDTQARAVRYMHDVFPAFSEFVNTLTSASWWIDNRDIDFNAIMRKAETWVHMDMGVDKQAEAEASPLLVKPETQNHTSFVRISTEGRTVSADYAKNAKFQEIVRDGLDYQWRGGVWQKRFSDLDSVTDREAELGNKLLAAGFTVLFASEAGRDKAISGEYTYEAKRRIYLIDKKFKLYWEYGNDTMYNRAKQLRTAKWDSGMGRMSVSLSAFAELEDFAEINRFVLSPEAKAAIQAEKDKIAKAATVKVKEKQKEKDTLKEILNSSKEVLTDLLDD